MKKHTSPAQKKDAPITKQESSTNPDRKQILKLLRTKPIHTIEFREIYGTITPTARIKELCLRVYDIYTKLIKAKSFDGRLRRNIALYTLQKEPATKSELSEVAA